MSAPASGVGKPEMIVAQLRPHVRALFWPSLALVAIVGATGFFAGQLPQAWMNYAVLGAGGVLAIVLFIAPLISWLSRNYTITTRRIVIRSGVWVRTRQELLHSRGYDVTVRKTGLQFMFGSGDVIVNAGLDMSVVMHDIPAADLVQSALHDLMERSLTPNAARQMPARSPHPDEEFDDDDWGDE